MSPRDKMIFDIVELLKSWKKILFLALYLHISK